MASEFVCTSAHAPLSAVSLPRHPGGCGGWGLFEEETLVACHAHMCELRILTGDAVAARCVCMSLMCLSQTVASCCALHTP